MHRMKNLRMIVFKVERIEFVSEEFHVCELLITFLSQMLVYYMTGKEDKESYRLKLLPQYRGFKYLLGHSVISKLPNNWVDYMYEDIKMYSFSFLEALQKANSPIFPIKFPYTINDIHLIFLQESE